MKIPIKYIMCGVFIVLLTNHSLYTQTLQTSSTTSGGLLTLTPLNINTATTQSPGSLTFYSTTPSTVTAVAFASTSPSFPAVTTFPTTGIITTQPLTAQQIQSYLAEAVSFSLPAFGATAEEKNKLQIYQTLLMGIFSDKTDPDLINKVVLNLATDIGVQATTIRTVSVDKLTDAKKALEYAKKLATDTINRYASQSVYMLVLNSLRATITAIGPQMTTIDSRINSNQPFMQELNNIKMLTNLADKVTRYRKLIPSITAYILEPTLTEFMNDLGRLITLAKQQAATEILKAIASILAEIEFNIYLTPTIKTKLAELKNFLTSPVATLPGTVTPTPSKLTPLPTLQPQTGSLSLPAQKGLLELTPTSKPIETATDKQQAIKNFLNPFAQSTTPKTAKTKEEQTKIELEELKKGLESKDNSYSTLVSACTKAVNKLKDKPPKEISSYLIGKLGEKLSFAYNNRAYQKPENIIELRTAFKAATEFKEFVSIVTTKRLETLNAAAQISISQTQTVPKSKIASLNLAMNMLKKDADNYEKTLFINELMSLFSNRAKYTKEELKEAYELLKAFTSKKNVSLKIFDQSAYQKATNWKNIMYALIIFSETPAQKTFKELISLYKTLFTYLALPEATYEREKFILVISSLFHHRVNLLQSDLQELKTFFEEITKTQNIISIQEVPNIVIFIRKVGHALQCATTQKSYLEVLIDQARATNDFKIYTKIVQKFTTHTPERVITSFITLLNKLIQNRAQFDKKALISLLKLVNTVKFADTIKLTDKPFILPNSPRKKAIEIWIAELEKE